MKRYIIRATAILPLLLAVLTVVSCTKDPEPSFKETETRSLEAWIKKYHPDLLENRQEDGGYYVEVLSAGTRDSLGNTIKSVLDSDDDEIEGCWVSFNMTGRDLQGQVCLTRDGWTARMEGTFTKFTHYVPYLRFVGKNNVSLLEGTYLAMKNTLTLGSKYASDNGLPTELSMCHGTKLRLYLPSSIVGGANGFGGDGGYEGQFSLDGNRPMIMEIEITDRINNPVAYEACAVDGFGIANGGVSPIKEVSDDDKEGDEESSDKEEEEEEDDGLAWRHSCDTIPGLLVTKRYTPGTKLNYSFDFTVDADEDEATGTTSGGKSVANIIYHDTDPASVYANFDLLEEQINAALIERFGEGSFDGEKIGEEGKAKVWYITRFLDGFVLDSNIAEVRKIVYGADEAADNELTYSPKDDQNDYIAAWYYALQELRYGQWATLITTSTFAYGSVGRSGSTSTTTSGGSSYAYMPYYNYYNYYNSYYGSSYYDMYYYNYYNNYLYNNYYSSNDTTTTTTSTSTEVQSYTPLLFQIFIEPEED